MYLWKVVLLMNCGKELHGYFECKHDDSASTAKELMSLKSDKVYEIVNDIDCSPKGICIWENKNRSSFDPQPADTTNEM